MLLVREGDGGKNATRRRYNQLEFSNQFIQLHCKIDDCSIYNPNNGMSSKIRNGFDIIPTYYTSKITVWKLSE
jgi:hypothetical protein